MSVIAFETATSELLECSCGNTVMDSGFDHVGAENCQLVHYQCARCYQFACVDYVNRVVTDADEHWITNKV